ncbi:MAG TPA: ATP-binding cassette domain-containing protein, partial [Gemmatimonadales bacterium]|nr:ATP-binding cassette domain-containing protein [Gemmatimonadales bacterium]
LRDLARATFGDLSGGQRQRVLVARALVQDAPVVLLDEPFTGLDARAAAQFRDLLRERAALGRALVIVTHQLAEAWELASRVAVLAGGRFALELPRAGALDDFLPRYAGACGG